MCKKKRIPKDTPPYFKKALLRAMKEYDDGIKHNKSALQNGAKKYVIDGKPGMIPTHYFTEKEALLKDFLTKHKKSKVRMVLRSEMEKQKKNDKGGDISYITTKKKFERNIHKNYETANEEQLLSLMEDEITSFIDTESDWYFNEIINLEIHTVDFKPMKGFSYIPLPEFIMRKKAIINMDNEDDKCFLWSVLRYLHPVKKNGSRINDLRKYENDLNFKGIH